MKCAGISAFSTLGVMAAKLLHRMHFKSSYYMQTYLVIQLQVDHSYQMLPYCLLKDISLHEISNKFQDYALTWELLDRYSLSQIKLI